MLTLAHFRVHKSWSDRGRNRRGPSCRPCPTGRETSSQRSARTNRPTVFGHMTGHVTGAKTGHMTGRGTSSPISARTNRQTDMPRITGHVTGQTRNRARVVVNGLCLELCAFFSTCTCQNIKCVSGVFNTQNAAA